MAASPNLQETFSGDFQNLFKFSMLEIQHGLFLSYGFGTDPFMILNGTRKSRDV